jgi:hypothetical protein
MVVSAPHPEPAGDRDDFQPVEALEGGSTPTRTSGGVPFLPTGLVLEYLLTDFALDLVTDPFSEVLQLVDVRSLGRPLRGEAFRYPLSDLCDPTLSFFRGHRKSPGPWGTAEEQETPTSYPK